MTAVPDWLGVRLNLPTVLLLFVVLSVIQAVLARWQTVLNTYAGLSNADWMSMILPHVYPFFLMLTMTFLKRLPNTAPPVEFGLVK